ncbi:hypothetical protein NW759_013551 [Fusarium solani]|jgi:hypothetical protein|nr:hypothetical protein NW759_013551 [Fusarium solani]
MMPEMLMVTVCVRRVWDGWSRENVRGGENKGEKNDMSGQSVSYRRISKELMGTTMRCDAMGPNGWMDGDRKGGDPMRPGVEDAPEEQSKATAGDFLVHN